MRHRDGTRKRRASGRHRVRREDTSAPRTRPGAWLLHGDDALSRLWDGPPLRGGSCSGRLVPMVSESDRGPADTASTRFLRRLCTLHGGPHRRGRHRFVFRWRPAPRADARVPARQAPVCGLPTLADHEARMTTDYRQVIEGGGGGPDRPCVRRGHRKAVCRSSPHPAASRKARGDVGPP